jgi:hypothetical protein
MDRNAFAEVFMIPVSRSLSSRLSWSKIAHSRSYELKLNGQRIGTLTRPTVWSSKFVAEAQAARWIFRHKGGFSSGVEIVNAGSDDVVANFRQGWSGGTLTFSDGQVFRIESRGCWRPVWTVADEYGQPVLHLHTREKSVEAQTDTGVSQERLLLLTMFTWYRKLQADDDAAAAVAVIVAS